jgi:hypothetical protein
VVFFVHLDEFHQVVDPKVGKGHHAVFADAIDPHDAVLDFHFVGDVPQPVLVLAELLGGVIDCGAVMDLVDVHGHAAGAEIANACAVQFQGSSSSSG